MDILNELLKDENISDRFKKAYKPNKKIIKAKPPTNFDVCESMDYIWEILSDYRNNCIPEGISNHDEIWDEICTSMAWIEEECGMKHGKKV